MPRMKRAELRCSGSGNGYTSVFAVDPYPYIPVSRSVLTPYWVGEGALKPINILNYQQTMDSPDLRRVGHASFAFDYVYICLGATRTYFWPESEKDICWLNCFCCCATHQFSSVGSVFDSQAENVRVWNLDILNGLKKWVPCAGLEPAISCFLSDGVWAELPE